MGILQDILNGINGGTHAPMPAGQTAPVTPPRYTLPQTIGSILAPEAGSFWSEALQHGLSGAKEAQANYAHMQKMQPLEDQTKQLAFDSAKAEAATAAEGYKQLGDTIVQKGPDGSFAPVYHAPNAQERLLDLYNQTPDGPYKELLKRMLSGYQYSEDYLSDKKKYAIPRAAGGGGGAGKSVTATSRAKYINEAEAAIAQGADRAAVYARLAKMGIH